MGTDNLISMADVARMTGQSRSTVGNWKARHADFPAPASRTSRGPLYERGAIEEWLQRTGRFRSIPMTSTSSPVSTVGRIPTPLERADAATVAGLLTLSVADASRPVDYARLSEALTLASLCERGDIAGLRDVVHSKFPFADGLIDWVSWAGRAAELASLHQEISSLDTKRIPELVDAAVTRCALTESGALRESPRDVVVLPPSVRLLAAGLLSPEGGDVLYQAGPGLGQLVIAAAHENENPPGAVYLQESSTRTAQLAHLNLIAHGVAATVESGDVLHRDAFPELRADRVIATPPWEPTTGLSGTTEDPRWGWGEPGANDGYLAWIQHCLYHLADGGRAVILLPLNAVFDRGRSAVQIRRRIVEDGHLEGVVSLPVGAIPGTTVRGVLLVLVKKPIEYETMMFDMSISPDGTPSPDGIPTLERARHVVDKYHEAAAGGLAEALNFTGVDAELLAPNDFILDPGRYQYAFGGVASEIEQMMINFGELRAGLELLVKACRKADREVATMLGMEL
ncbi:MAG: N-6 DNA methylase [Mycobacterium sp.]|nr:N-6 DNA methylase [Mycobacterium sp.]